MAVSAILVDNMEESLAFCGTSLLVAFSGSTIQDSFGYNGSGTNIPTRLLARRRASFIPLSLQVFGKSRGTGAVEVNSCGVFRQAQTVSMGAGGEDNKQGTDENKDSDSSSVVGVADEGGEKEDTSSENSEKRQYSLRTRLREETEAPFRKARMFIYAGSAASAGVGAFISTLRIISALVGTRGVQPLSETVRYIPENQLRFGVRRTRSLCMSVKNTLPTTSIV